MTPASIEDVARSLVERLQFDPHSESSSVNITTAEQKEMLQVLRQLREKLGGLKQGACSALQMKAEKLLDDPKMAEAEGPGGYVEMKVQLLLSYIIGLQYYLLLKVSGKEVREHPVVPRLLWIRTLLEKLKPVDQRLQYQMSRLMQWADARKSETAGAERVDTRALKPGSLVSSVDDDGDEEEQEAEEPAAPADGHLGAYRPPKISQVEYTGDHVSMQERAEKDMERKKARLERSEFMRSLREEFTDAPKEVVGEIRTDRADKAARMLRERQEYEEETMQRTRMTKIEARKTRQSLRDGRAQSGGAVSMYEAAADFGEIVKSLDSEKGKGGGKGKKRRAGGVLQEYHSAKRRVQGIRENVSSAMDSTPGKRKGKGGGRGKPRGKH